MLFIAFDGIDGAGKTTQMERTEGWLRQRCDQAGRGQTVLRVRDPGSTAGGEAIRGLLLDSDLQLHRRTEALLYMAARCQLVEEKVRPALTEGHVVLSDRFLLSNVAYQSVGGHVTADQVWHLGLLATEGLLPTLTVLLDLPAEVAYSRMQRPADRMERRGVEYMESVRQRFLEEVSRSAKHFVIVDATRDPEAVWQQIEAKLVEVWEKR